MEHNMMNCRLFISLIVLTTCHRVLVPFGLLNFEGSKAHRGIQFPTLPYL